jgi:hypothetical protein
MLRGITAPEQNLDGKTEGRPLGGWRWSVGPTPRRMSWWQKPLHARHQGREHHGDLTTGTPRRPVVLSLPKNDRVKLDRDTRCRRLWNIVKMVAMTKHHGGRRPVDQPKHYASVSGSAKQDRETQRKAIVDMANRVQAARTYGMNRFAMVAAGVRALGGRCQREKSWSGSWPSAASVEMRS